MWREQHDHFFGEANISIFQRQQFTSTLFFMQVVYHFSTEYKNSAMTELTAVRLAQLGELRSAEREGAVCLTNSQGLLKKWWDHAWLWIKILPLFRCSHHWAVTLSRWPCLLHPSFIVRSNRRRPSPTVWKSRPVGWPTFISWVGYSKFINGLLMAASGALVYRGPSLLLPHVNIKCSKTH